MGTSASFAEIATRMEMNRVCGNWLEYIVHETGSWGNSEVPEVIRVEDINANGRVLALCYSISPSGHVVVPVLKDLPPIMAYSQDCPLEKGQYQSIGTILTEVLSDRTSRFIDAYGSIEAIQSDQEVELFDQRNRDAWDRYLMSSDEFEAFLKSKSRDRYEQVGPLLSTAWHQTAPYNQYCPMGDGGQCVVWCVATSLSQILWYHQWPPAGFGHTSYSWNGDQSCGGDSYSGLLVANFSDRYGYTGTIHEMAELCMEVGKSYNVDYGVCYSIGSAGPITDLLPDNFAYYDIVTELARSDYTAQEWFELVQEEIDKNQPIDYLIYNHKIAADGWATDGPQNYYHMNYGWGGAYNTWFAIDNLHCDWAGCDPMVERMWTNIIPDKTVMFYGDTIAGQVPLEIDFTGTSDRAVDEWLWTFGDGDTSPDQSPTHTYSEAGVYDVSLRIDYGDSSALKTRDQYIYALADSIRLEDAEAEPGGEVEVRIYANNTVPLEEIFIPFAYDGDVDLEYFYIENTDTRTYGIDGLGAQDIDNINHRFNVRMISHVTGDFPDPFIEPGDGLILKVVFKVAADAQHGQQTTIRMGGYDTYSPTYYGSIYGFEHTYQPVTVAGIVTVIEPILCGDADGSGEIDIDDAVFLINYIFAGGPPPDPLASGDTDCSGGIDIDDVVQVIGYIFAGGNAPCDIDGDGVPDC